MKSSSASVTRGHCPMSRAMLASVLSVVCQVQDIVYSSYVLRSAYPHPFTKCAWKQRKSNISQTPNPVDTSHSHAYGCCRVK